MKPPAEWTSEQFADLLRLSQQFSEEEARSTMDRWEREAGDTAEVSRFIRWLIARGYLTESQANELLRDNPLAGGPQAAPAVPIAQAPPRIERPESSPVQPMKAVIVAPAANPRAGARAESPAEPGIDVELVDAIIAAPPAPVAAPILDAEIFADLANPVQPPEPASGVGAIAPAEQPIPVDETPAVKQAPVASPIDWTNIWLHLCLGALGLLAAEFAGWLLAQVVARVL